MLAIKSGACFWSSSREKRLYCVLFCIFPSVNIYGVLSRVCSRVLRRRRERRPRRCPRGQRGHVALVHRARIARGRNERGPRARAGAAVARRERADALGVADDDEVAARARDRDVEAARLGDEAKRCPTSLCDSTYMLFRGRLLSQIVSPTISILSASSYQPVQSFQRVLDRNTGRSQHYDRYRLARPNQRGDNLTARIPQPTNARAVQAY